MIIGWIMIFAGAALLSWGRTCYLAEAAAERRRREEWQ